MRRDEGPIKREHLFARSLSPAQSSQQRRPGRIGRIARRWNSLLIAASHIDGEQRRARTTTGIAEEHHHAPVGRPGRTLVVIAFSENAFAGSVRPYDTDCEASFRLLGEGDVVAAWRPDRRRISALAEADALCSAAIRAHDINLLTAAAIRLEADARAVRRERWRRVDGGSVGEPRRGLRAQIHQKDVGVAALLQAHDHALTVGGKTRREGHARKVPDNLALPGLDIEQIDARLSLR